MRKSSRTSRLWRKSRLEYHCARLKIARTYVVAIVEPSVIVERINIAREIMGVMTVAIALLHVKHKMLPRQLIPSPRSLWGKELPAGTTCKVSLFHFDVVEAQVAFATSHTLICDYILWAR